MASPEEFKNAEQAKRVDAACDQFEEAWNSENRKRIEDIVADESAELRNQLLLHLIQLEIQLRNETNEAFQLSEYLDRFPEYQHIVTHRDWHAFDWRARNNVARR